MRPSPIDFRVRAQLTELMDEPCSRDELRACLLDLARTNRWTLGYRPVLRWLDVLVRSQPRNAEPIRIFDVGCGYGDTLRRVEQWANQRAIPVELSGLDINPNATAIAAGASPASSRIQWIGADVFQYVPSKPPNLVISSLFTHHLSNADVIRFLGWRSTRHRVGLSTIFLGLRFLIISFAPSQNWPGSIALCNMTALSPSRVPL